MWETATLFLLYRLSLAQKHFEEEDGENGRRKEERAAFLQRAAGNGYSVYEGKTAAYGHRAVQGRSTRENARQVLEEVKALGIDADIIDGPVLLNGGNVTATRDVQEAVTVVGSFILITKYRREYRLC